MGTRITSNNQKGGITAGNVNIGNQINSGKVQKSRMPTWLTVLAAGATIIAAIFAVITFFSN
jgi:hypothetical protein